ncbi:MAG: hypothetical protein ACI92S_003588, partial [Planctomycetaceae bacterium]
MKINISTNTDKDKHWLQRESLGWLQSIDKNSRLRSSKSAAFGRRLPNSTRLLRAEICPVCKSRMPRFRRPISISNPVPSGGTRVNSGCGVESRGWVQSATSANTHLAKTNCHSPALRRRRGLLAQAFGLADEFLLIRSATTFGANMRGITDKL